MTREQDGDRETDYTADNGIHLEARASDAARVFQAGRDLHIRYESGTSGVRRVRQSSVVEECPYPGLAAFGPETAQWFFGRDAVLAELTGLLSEQPPGLVVLVASSGAGKSSLLQAGLIPALDRGVLPQAGSRRWPRLIFTPTAHPLAALSARLSTVTGATTEQVSALLADDPLRAATLVQDAARSSAIVGLWKRVHPKRAETISDELAEASRIVMKAQASDHGRVFQAGRDMNITGQ